MSSSRKLKVAVAQLQSAPDPYLNLAWVQDFHEMSAAHGAQLLCFPENVFYRGPKKTESFSRPEIVLERTDKGELIDNHAFSGALLEFLQNIKCVVSLGSVLERSPSVDRPYNSHWVCYPGGRIESYRKIHLFNYTGGAGTYRESEEFTAGSEPKVVDVAGWKVGLGICYDLRFAELFRHLVLKGGAEILLLPAAFTRSTGEAHWHTLLQARAIENLSYVLASGQWGKHCDSRGQELYCYGHSLMISPWGEVLQEAPPESDALLLQELTDEDLHLRRSQLPALQSAKLFHGI